MSQFELVWDSRCGVAESPVWDASTRRLLFCDIPGKRINALSVGDGAQTSWDFPEVVGSFGLCRSGRLVVALRHRVVLFDPRTKVIEQLTDPVDEPPTNRFNDGKVGPNGCFWVGSSWTNVRRASRPAPCIASRREAGSSARPRATRCPTASPGPPMAGSCSGSELHVRRHRGVGLRPPHRRACQPPHPGVSHHSIPTPLT